MSHIVVKVVNVLSDAPSFVKVVSVDFSEPHADLIDYNLGCPLGYMLGKKGGCYLMKHSDQLYKIIKDFFDLEKVKSGASYSAIGIDASCSGSSIIAGLIANINCIELTNVFVNNIIQIQIL